MNYLELIQKVCILYGIDKPASFSDASDSDYDKIKLEIDNALLDVYYSRLFNFRMKTGSLSIIAGVRNYFNTYGLITEDGLSIPAKKYIPLSLVSYSDIVDKTETGLPKNYAIYGNVINFYPVPDANYTASVRYLTRRPVQNKTTVDQLSTSGQTKLYVTRTSGFVTGETVYIENNTGNYEAGIISAITTNDYLTLSGNLTYSHSIGATVYQETQKLVYEQDELNIPDEYHELVIYKAMVNLLSTQPDMLPVWMQRYREKVNTILREQNEAEGNNPRFIIEG